MDMEMDQSPEGMESGMMGEMDDMEYGEEGEQHMMEGEHDPYGQEGEGEFDEYEMQGEGEEEDAEQEEELDFQSDPQFAGLPPLDKMRKVRREIIRTINDIRAKFNNASLH